MTLYVLLQRLYFQNLWSININDVGFVKVTLVECRRFHTVVQVHKILHQLVASYLFIFRVCICLLRMSPDMLVETIIAYLFLEYGLLMNKERGGNLEPDFVFSK